MSESKLNQHDLELVSASLDSELSDFERRRLNDKILIDRQAAEKLNRYTLVSAILKKECPAQINTSFDIQIQHAVENTLQVSHAPQPSPIFKQIASLAIAVSVAIVSYIGLQQFPQLNPDTDQYLSDKNNNEKWDTEKSISESYKRQISPQVQFAPAQLNTSNKQDVQAYEREIEIYIHNHSGYGSERIILPYEEITELRDMNE